MRLLRRQFALGDLMIVVAASAISLAVLRATVDTTGGGYLRHVPAPYSHWRGPLPLGYELSSRFFFMLYNGVPQIVVVSFCVVVLSVRARMVSKLQLSHRPGFVLSLVAVTASAWTTLLNFRSLHWSVASLGPWRLVVNQILPNAGFMVLGAWITLATVGRRKPAPSWVDRTGYAVCGLLIVMLILDCLRFLLESVRFL